MLPEQHEPRQRGDRRREAHQHRERRRRQAPQRDIGRVRAQRFRRRNTDLAAELLASGRLVDAEVTSSPLLSAEAMTASRTAVSLTFAFDDGQGARRWVTCLALLPPREVPAEGETRPLVFDPRTPSDVKRIFVSPTGDLEPSAFVAVRAA